MPRLVLLLGCMCRGLHADLVPRASDLLTQFISTDSASLDDTDLRRHSQAAANRLVAHYVSDKQPLLLKFQI